MKLLTNIFNKRFSLDMLEEYLSKRRQKMQTDLSSRCKILFIDDLIETPEYPLREELDLLRQSNKYNITVKTDLDSLTDAAGYDLIICDNHGIGIKICGRSGNGISL